MPSYQHVISVGADGSRTLTVFIPGEKQPIMINGTHPHYDRLLFEAEQGELSAGAMYDYVINAPVEDDE